MRSAADVIQDALEPQLAPADARERSLAVVEALTGLGLTIIESETVDRLKRACVAVRRDCRDPDTDAAISPATGELIEEALAAVGVRL